MPAFFITSRDIHGDSIFITGDLLHHLRASLRLHIDEPVHLTDERRRRYHAIVTNLTRERLTARITGSFEGPHHSYPRLTLGQAILKGDHMDWITQKATELGVDRIVPLIAHRSVVRPQQARVPSQTARWQRIAREAAQQSEQWQIPTVQAPLEFREFISQPNATTRLILVERGDGKRLADFELPDEPAASVAVLVGPEGGWHAEEVAIAREHAFEPISLGPAILRAETAALAVLALLRNRWGALG